MRLSLSWKVLVWASCCIGSARSVSETAPSAWCICMTKRCRNVSLLGLTTAEEIRKRSVLFRSLCLPGYLIYVLICVYAINGARGFWPGFWQGFVILSVMNLIDRFLIDEYWVGHTKAWIIPGTEDLRPYITAKDKKQKWIMGTVGMAFIAAVLAGIMAVILK